MLQKGMLKVLQNQLPLLHFQPLVSLVTLVAAIASATCQPVVCNRESQCATLSSMLHSEKYAPLARLTLLVTGQ